MMSNLILLTNNKKCCGKEVEAFKQVLNYQYQDHFEHVIF